MRQSYVRLFGVGPIKLTDKAIGFLLSSLKLALKPYLKGWFFYILISY